MASSFAASREKTPPMPFFTISRDNTYGGTAVAVPAIVATAGTILCLSLVCGSRRLANASSTSKDFGVRVDDTVRLLQLRLGILAVKETARQTSYYDRWDAGSYRQVRKKMKNAFDPAAHPTVEPVRLPTFQKNAAPFLRKGSAARKPTPTSCRFRTAWISLAWCTSPR